VVADEDWTTLVTRNPEATPENRFEVIYPRIFWSREPADCWSPSLIMRIPKRKTPKLPTIVRMCRTVVTAYLQEISG
jgi:hypothetical protein